MVQQVEVSDSVDDNTLNELSVSLCIQEILRDRRVLLHPLHPLVEEGEPLPGELQLSLSDSQVRILPLC